MTLFVGDGCAGWPERLRFRRRIEEYVLVHILYRRYRNAEG